MNSFLEKLKQGYQSGNTVQRLLYWNIGVSILVLLIHVFSAHFHQEVINWLGLSSDPKTAFTRFWTFLTYSFIHASVIHLLFNMLMLFFVGQLFKTFFTEIQLLGVYLLGSIFAGLIYVVAYLFIDGIGVVVGASAAIMALLFTVTSYAPQMSVRLLLLGNVKMWHIAAVFVFLDIVQIPMSNTGGHIAHLGGALFGFLYIQLLKQNIDLSRFIVWVNTLFLPKKSNKKQFKNVYRNNKGTEKMFRSSLDKNETQKRIDAILDKIKKSGYDSLSKEEKEFLFRQQ